MTHYPACGWSMAGPVYDREHDAFTYTCRRCGQVEHAVAMSEALALELWREAAGLSEFEVSIALEQARPQLRLVSSHRGAP